MKRKVLRISVLLSVLLLTTFALSFRAQAQVTIGSNAEPNADALLDLNEGAGTDEHTSSKGLLLPRVGLEATNSHEPLNAFVEGMTVYNTNSKGDVTPGYYYCDGHRWLHLNTESERIIYAPSIVVPTGEDSFAVIDTPDDAAFSHTLLPDGVNYTYTIDLYAIYNRQFTTPAIANPAAATSPLPVYAANRLNYYVTYADSNIFTFTGLTDDGKLSYTVNTTGAITAKTFMNIVFKIK